MGSWQPHPNPGEGTGGKETASGRISDRLCCTLVEDARNSRDSGLPDMKCTFARLEPLKAGHVPGNDFLPAWH